MIKAAIIQSSYIPWKGYFDIISNCDIFVFLEDTQFTRRDWRTRNKIRFSNGQSNWLTIPVGKPPRDTLINEVIFIDNSWKEDHLSKFYFNYKKSPFFSDLKMVCYEIYENDILNLSEFNRNAIEKITRIIGIDNVKFINSNELKTSGFKSEKLVNILNAIGADYYISGPAAKDYMELSMFSDNGIEVEYKEYGPYKEYSPVYGEFENELTILDVIAHVGLNRVREYIT